MTADDLKGATGYKLRRIFSHWWLKLFNAAGENVGDYGPLDWRETDQAQADAKRLGLADIERDLGSRGK